MFHRILVDQRMFQTRSVVTVPRSWKEIPWTVGVMVPWGLPLTAYSYISSPRHHWPMSTNLKRLLLAKVVTNIYADRMTRWLDENVCWRGMQKGSVRPWGCFPLPQDNDISILHSHLMATDKVSESADILLFVIHCALSNPPHIKLHITEQSWVHVWFTGIKCCSVRLAIWSSMPIVQC
jgi:hypothetical protein